MLHEIAIRIGKLFGSAQAVQNERERVRKLAEAAAALEAEKWARIATALGQALFAAGVRLEQDSGGEYRFWIDAPPPAPPADKAIAARETLQRFAGMLSREGSVLRSDRTLFRAAIKETHPDGQGAHRSAENFKTVIAAGETLGLGTGGKKEA